MYAELRHTILNIKAAALGPNLRTGTLAVAVGLWKALAFRLETPDLGHEIGSANSGGLPKERVYCPSAKYRLPDTYRARILVDRNSPARQGFL